MLDLIRKINSRDILPKVHYLLNVSQYLKRQHQCRYKSKHEYDILKIAVLNNPYQLDSHPNWVFDILMEIIVQENTRRQLVEGSESDY